MKYCLNAAFFDLSNDIILGALKKIISAVPNDDILHAIYGIFIGRPQQFIQFSYPIAFGNSC